jgi:zinc transport system ATP-binding protein
MAEKIVELRNLSFDYGGQHVIDNATFSVTRGDFVGMIGPNGGGKTTLIKIILGLLKPDRGTVKLFGEDISKFNEWQHVGYVPQKATSFDQNFPATVFEVASMGRFPKAGLTKQLSDKDYEAVEKALDLVGMLKLRNRRIGDLSGGQQQRVFMARALATEPELLILDEPTVGVDAEAQHNFYSLLRKLNKKLGMTLILASHDVGMVTRDINKLACVNIAVTFHDVSKGFSRKELFCAYPEGMNLVPHHHDSVKP